MKAFKRFLTLALQPATILLALVMACILYAASHEHGAADFWLTFAETYGGAVTGHALYALYKWAAGR